MSNSVSKDGQAVIKAVLAACAPRPDSNSSPGKKNKYAVRFADHMARRIAADLTPKFEGIDATTKRTARSVRGQKQLDVNFSTPQLGLALGISLKSVHLRDQTSDRYTHNMKRNEEELRIEASGYHKRQPYAVMVGVLFLPFDSCDDARKEASSFGSWVRHLRPYCGRREPDDEIDRFEKLYIALYETDGSDLRFFDVESDPPKRGRPRSTGELIGEDGRPNRLLTYLEFLENIQRVYLHRNNAEFIWEGGDPEPLPTEGIAEDPADDEEEDS